MHGISPVRDVDMKMIAENRGADEARLNPAPLTGRTTKATIAAWAIA
jgi:hypothetical protein